MSNDTLKLVAPTIDASVRNNPIDHVPKMWANVGNGKTMELPRHIFRNGYEPDGGTSSSRRGIDTRNYIYGFSERRVKVGGRNPLDVYGLRTYGEKFWGDGFKAQTHHHRGWIMQSSMRVWWIKANIIFLLNCQGAFPPRSADWRWKLNSCGSIRKA